MIHPVEHFEKGRDNKIRAADVSSVSNSLGITPVISNEFPTPTFIKWKNKTSLANQLKISFSLNND